MLNCDVPSMENVFDPRPNTTSPPTLNWLNCVTAIAPVALFASANRTLPPTYIVLNPSTFSVPLDVLSL